MMTDPRLTTFLKLAAERGHPFYAWAAYALAKAAGDKGAVKQAVRLGALSYRPEPKVYAWTEPLPLFEMEEAA